MLFKFSAHPDGIEKAPYFCLVVAESVSLAIELGIKVFLALEPGENIDNYFCHASDP